MSAPDELFAAYEHWSAGVVNSLLESLDPDASLLVDGQAHQAGLMGLMRASRTFDARKGSFVNYAAVCIKQALMDEIRGESRQPDTYDGADTRPAKTTPSRDISAYLAFLSRPLHKRVIRLRYMDGLSQPEVAKRIGVCQQRVDKYEKEALAEIRRRMGVDDE